MFINIVSSHRYYFSISHHRSSKQGTSLSKDVENRYCLADFRKRIFQRKKVNFHEWTWEYAPCALSPKISPYQISHDYICYTSFRAEAICVLPIYIYAYATANFPRNQPIIYAIYFLSKILHNFHATLYSVPNRGRPNFYSMWRTIKIF